jgi:hypothetical protein
MSGTVLSLKLANHAKLSGKSMLYKNLLNKSVTTVSKPKKACCSSCKSGKKCESEKGHHH